MVSEEDDNKKFYMLWQTDDKTEDKYSTDCTRIPAPKMSCLGHKSRTTRQCSICSRTGKKKEWESGPQRTGIEENYHLFLIIFVVIGKVPAYFRFHQRAVGTGVWTLYLAPKDEEDEVNIQPEDLVLSCPASGPPAHPTVVASPQKGQNMVREHQLEPFGQYILGSDDGTCKILGGADWSLFEDH